MPRSLEGSGRGMNSIIVILSVQTIWMIYRDMRQFKLHNLDFIHKHNQQTLVRNIELANQDCDSWRAKCLAVAAELDALQNPKIEVLP